MEKKMLDCLTAEINKKISDDTKLYFEDKKGYYEKQITEIEARIEELKEQNKLYSKIKKSDRDKPINGDAHLITYNEAIERNKDEIHDLKLDIRVLKQEIKNESRNS